MPTNWLYVLCGDVIVLGVASILLVSIRRLLAFRVNARASSLPMTVALQAALIVGFGTLLAAYFLGFVPRYFTITIPILMIVLASVMVDLLGERLTLFVLLVATGVNIVNWNGTLFISMESTPSLQPLASWSAFRERSREYSRVYDSLRTAITQLEEVLNENSIVLTHNPLGTLLAFPELGYVDRPLHGFSTESNSTLPDQFSDLGENFEHLKRILIADKDTDIFVIGWRYPFWQTDPTDKIIYKDPLTTIIVHQVTAKRALEIAEESMKNRGS